MNKTLKNRRAISRIQAVSVLVVIVVVALVGTYFAIPPQPPPPPPPPPPKVGETLVTMTYDDPTSLDPHVTDTKQSMAIIANVYETLLIYEGTELKPLLAESYDVSADLLVYTFRLRKGVKFHDGTAFNAQAVKFSFDRLMKLGKAPAALFTAVKSCRVVDEYTIAFDLKTRYVPVLSCFGASQGLNVVSPKAVQDHQVGDDLATKWMHENMVGTGPFKFVEWTRGVQVVMQRNVEYHKGWPQERFLDKVIVKIVRDEATRALVLRKGEVDLNMRDTSPEICPELEIEPGIVLRKFLSFNIFVVCMNMLNKPLSDVRVRRAISYAWDYKGAIDRIMLGRATQPYGIIPKGMLGYDESIPRYSYDPEKAKSILKDAGYKPGDIKLNMIYVSGLLYQRQVVEILDANLAAIGIKLEARAMTYPALVKIMQDPDPTKRADLATAYHMAFYLDPACLMDSIFLPGMPLNFQGSDNKEVNAILDRASSISDANERAALYSKAMKIIMEDAPMLFCWQGTTAIAYRDYVYGVEYNPLRHNYILLYNVYIMRKK